MSVSTSIKQTLVDKINALSSTQAVYPYARLDPEGWPAVWVITSNLTGSFLSTAENERVYGYEVWTLFPQGQDFEGSDKDRPEFAEDRIAEVTDDIINAIATDFTLSTGSPADDVLWVEAADAVWGVVDYEGGKAAACTITFLIHTCINIT